MSPQEFQADLLSNGYKISKHGTGEKGAFTVISNGEKSYTIYMVATSTEGPTAQVTDAAGKILSKIRLGGS